MSPVVLAPYDPIRPTIISADASNTGICAVSFKAKITENAAQFATRPDFSVTQRSLRRHREKTLAVTWASEKFFDHMLGISFVLETDHKSLTTLLNLTGQGAGATRTLPVPPET